MQNCSDSQKNERFLTLLCALCECNGESISGNQDYICEFVLEVEEFKHLLILIQQIGGKYYAKFDD